jgi:transposase
LSRELKAFGHTVRLMPAAYVKPYVKRQKNDAADAEAICEAVTRINMRFVATKTPDQQSCLTLHRARHLFIRQQTAVSRNYGVTRQMSSEPMMMTKITSNTLIACPLEH